jgi:hypothetical protein
MTMRRHVISGFLAGNALAVSAAAQQPSPSQPPVLRARAVDATADVKIFHPSGSIRLIGWDRDSLVVRGRVPNSDRLLVGTTEKGAKIAIESKHPGDDVTPAELVVYVPRGASVAVKSVDASVTASNVSGWFYSVSAAIVITGTAAEIEAESMSGDVLLDVAAPWVKARTGRGRLVVRGTPEDVDVSTVGGALDILASTIVRGRFASVTGDIHYTAPFARGGLYDFSNHGGAVELKLPAGVSASIDLSTVMGAIDNRFGELRPVASDPHTLRVRLGSGAAAATVRTFRGPIRIIRQ